MRSHLRSADALSPESTVTSLLSSSGHLTSNLQPSLHASFTYKNKMYESASAALDAYITDFERSRHGNTPKGAGLPLSSSHWTTLGTLRNRDVLRERLSEQELDFLTLPVSSLHHRDNRDRISMTTDELLSLPNDGSMPITHTSAFLQGLASQSGISQVRSPVKNTCSHSHAHRGSSQPIRAHHCPRCAAGLQSTLTTAPLSSTLKPGPETAASQWAGPSSAPRPDWLSRRDQVTLHLPHWLSSNKAVLDCSDVQSLPDLPYPPWIRHCHAGQSERSASHEDGQSERNVSHEDGQSERNVSHEDGQSEQAYGQGQAQEAEIPDFGPSAPSWVQELHEDQPVQSEEPLKSLHLHFTQRLSHSASENRVCTDRRLESLIQKADRVLDSLQNSATGSPVPPDPEPATRNTQPGPLEAVKQILFRLQTVEAELYRRQDAQQGAPQLQQGALQPQQGALQPQQGALQQGAPQLQQEAPQLQQEVPQLQQEVPQLQQAALLETVTQNPEDEEEPSLQRALHHLSRLKLLVEKPEEPEEPRILQNLQKHRDTREEEEEERDEGRFSSCSLLDQQGALGGPL